MDPISNIVFKKDNKKRLRGPHVYGIFLKIMKMNECKCFTLALILICCSWKIAAESLHPIFWNKEVPSINLAPHISFIEDESKKESFETIREKFANGEGNTTQAKSIGFGYSKSAYWIEWKIQIEEQNTTDLWLELVSLIDSIDFYLIRDKEQISKLHTGRNESASQRYILHRNFIFSLPLEKQGTYQVIMRFESQGSLLLPLTLWTKESYLAEESIKTTLFGAYFGVMGVVFFYNLFLFLSIRDRSYLYYILYIFFLTLVQSSIWGYTHAYVFPEYPSIADISFPFAIGLVNTFALLFARQFVDAKSKMPKLNVYLLIIAILSATTILPAFLGFYRLSVMSGLFITVVSSLTLVFVSSYAWLKGYNQARFFLLGSSVVLLGAIILGLRNFGILPYHFLTNYSVQLGSVLEAIFLSISLADRINFIQKEKADLQAKSLAEQQTLTESFSRFFPSQIIPLLNKKDVRDVALGDAVDGEVAILFLDIRGFTSISEKLSPRLTFDFLNAFMRFTAPSIERMSGYIDKYIGDSIMAFFPKSSENALKAAKDMLVGLAEFNKKRTELGEEEVKIGIGIHYGKVLIGTIGQKTRMDGTLIGDTVNTASRLEGKTKELGTSILLSEVAFNMLSEESRSSLKLFGEIELRGREEKLSVYGLKS
jgi:adenylate cyclase